MGTSERCSNEPYLSFVAISRNDNHGGDMTKRMQIFVSCLMEQTRRHRLPAELVLVEWNPPPERPPLAEELRWPDSGGFCPVRIIRVPPEIHRRFKHSDKLPLFQMIGKNVGIRRARAPFVLCTNVDVIFSEELMEFLAKRELEPRVMYRVNRIDVASDIPSGLPARETINWCRRKVKWVDARYGTIR